MFMSEYQFNPIYNKVPTGASLVNKNVKYSLKINKSIGSTAVFFNYCFDGSNTTTLVKMQSNELGDEIEYSVTITFESVGLYWYCFQVFQGEHSYFLQKDNNFNVSPTGNNPSRFQQLVYANENKVEANYNSGVMYHIFVDRFCKKGEVKPHTDMILRDDWGGEITKNSQSFKVINKECFGGNLNGIIGKLDYLKSLNVTTIYLSPIFEANSYHKYDTADYSKIDSMFGTEKDFVSLILKAKLKNINIILDGVFNHTGDDSVYFNKYSTYNSVGAYQSKNSLYYDWYNFTDYPEKYDSWWGIDCMPQIKDNSPNFTNFLCGNCGILKKYMKLGLLGFRLDVVDEIENSKLNQICSSIREVKKNALILGEVWEDASNKIAYGYRRNYFLGKQLNSVMNYPLKDAIINYIETKNCSNLRNTIFMLLDHYPKNVCDNLMNILGTHDSSRIMSVINAFTNNKLEAESLLKIATLLQFTCFGVPCIFYGDEQGLQGVNAPYCRVCMPTKNANIKLTNWYKFLGKLRTEKVFETGKLNVLVADNELFGFERVDKKIKFIFLTNCGLEEKHFTLQHKFKNYETGKMENNIVSIKPKSYLILTNKI